MTIAFSVFRQDDDNLTLLFEGTSTRRFTVMP